MNLQKRKHECKEYKDNYECKQSADTSLHNLILKMYIGSCLTPSRISRISAKLKVFLPSSQSWSLYD